MVGLKPRDPLATDTIASDLIESILAPAPESRDAGLLLSNLGAKGTKEVFDDAIGEEQTTKTYMDEQEKAHMLIRSKSSYLTALLLRPQKTSLQVLLMLLL